MSTEEQKETLARLESFSDKTLGQDDIVREGSQLVLPDGMSLVHAIRFLTKVNDDLQEYTAFTRAFPYLPEDGCHALGQVIRNVTGAPPTAVQQTHEVQISLTETVQVPMREMYLDAIDAYVKTSHVGDPDFKIMIEAQRKHAKAVDGLFEAVDAYLKENSIYKGKVINGDMTFLDTTSVDRSKIVYTDFVFRELNTHVLSPIKDADAVRAAGLPGRRAVLLHGPYGTGKTLAAMATAQMCEQEGWTFVYVRPDDDLYKTLELARMYEPAVVFVEDADERTKDGDIVKILDAFDGMAAKSQNLQIVMTTNHPERIHKGMIRPGRLDALIEIAAPDDDAIRRFVDTFVPSHMRGEIDLDRVAASMQGYLPAFIKEAVDRSVRYAISNDGEFVEQITTAHLVAAANGLRPQWEMMNGDVVSTQPTLDVAFADVITEVVNAELSSALNGSH